LLHTLNALLVAWFLILLTGKRAIGLIAGLLFLMHPIHTEAVAWAAARKDVLSAIFFLASLIAYLAHHQRKTKNQQTNNKSTMRYVYGMYLLSLTFFFLGLLSKVTIIFLPFILLLIDWYQGRSIDRKALKEKILYVILSIIFLVIAFYGKTARVAYGSYVWEKFLLACRSITFSLEKLIIPKDFSVLYPYSNDIQLTNPDLLLSLFFVIALSIIVFLLAKRTKLPLFLWGFFLLTLLPSFGGLTREHTSVIEFYIASDRYAYLPSISFFLIVALALATVIERKRLFGLALMLLVLLSLSFLSYRQSNVWKDTETLFRHVAAVEPDSQVAHLKIAEAHLSRGEFAEAKTSFEASVQAHPNGVASYYLGLLALQSGKREEAKQAFRDAIAASPIDTLSYLALANILAQEGKRDEAIDVLTTLFSAEAVLKEGREEALQLLQQLLSEREG
ncbi:MAG: tetratricopeptide repeat protein, partial [Patescibacteria group bacterium]